jgi:hypothetical protein
VRLSSTEFGETLEGHDGANLEAWIK